MTIKSDEEIFRMREAGLVLWEAHQKAKELIKEGITTYEIDNAVEKYILSHGAVPLFKGVPGKIPYPAATCISINEEVVHGIPSNRKLVAGDIVSIDIGVKLKGWCSDAATTLPVGNISDEKRRLLTETENALRFAIKQLSVKTHWSLIVKEMQRRIESKGFSIVEDLVGHGIGRELWEHPQIPNYFSSNNEDFRTRPGTTLAIEPMVNLGSKEVRLKNDHWTIVTEDGKPSAHFEHTVAISRSGPVVLTCGPNGEGWAM
ncbi:MAG: type I methionyl aminopeptidase [Desulfuromonadales bacterium]|nr:type I methionyl aminopeptidase [Desulfuromonadales bacterium]